jgi:hypothetical protein
MYSKRIHLIEGKESRGVLKTSFKNSFLIPRGGCVLIATQRPHRIAMQRNDTE